MHPCSIIIIFDAQYLISFATDVRTCLYRTLTHHSLLAMSAFIRRVGWVGENPELDLAHGGKGVLHTGNAADRTVLEMAGMGLHTDKADLHEPEPEVERHPRHGRHHHH